MLNAESTGLIVVDIQGKLAQLVADSEKVIANCAKLIQGVQLLGLPVLWLEQTPEKIGTTVPEISRLLHGHTVIKKSTFSAGGSPEFLKAVQAAQVKTWLVCGIEAHICVYQTASYLQKNGYDVQLVVDCISSRTPENKALAVSRLSREQVSVTGLEMCLYELMKDSKNPAFKEILHLIK